MIKSLFIAEKPSVAREFAKTLGVSGSTSGGYLENDNYIVTWCIGHLVTMSYPEKYDPALKKWNLSTLPFVPENYLYEIIPSAKNQFKVVSSLLSRKDVGKIYVCTDSGREGEYIYRLVEMMSSSDVKNKERRRVWIDSQTEDEIKKGIENAKPLSEYDNLASSAFLRAKEDYLMGINFSRVLTLKYGNQISSLMGGKWSAVSVGRVMTCVLGMVVRREREIRNFVKTPFYRISGRFSTENSSFDGLWHATEKSCKYGSFELYKDNGFKNKKDAEEFIAYLKSIRPFDATVSGISKKTEKKNPPLLYNLAELQNDCSKIFHISPDETLQAVQTLYENKLVTYPRTDARVLSTAVAKEIHKNIAGLKAYSPAGDFASEILSEKLYSGIIKSKYTNDKLITDHYAIIPTGQGIQGLSKHSKLHRDIFSLICARFLSVFYPAAEYNKITVTTDIGNESFSSGCRSLVKKGYLKVTEAFGGSKKIPSEKNSGDSGISDISSVEGLRKGQKLKIESFEVKEGEVTPPKRYTSGSMILAMENAGQLIEDPELREQIKGSGIGTSATRAEILKKLFTINYLKLNKKTQVITPAQLGELVYDATEISIKPMLEPALTASWEKGLTYVAEGSISENEYMEKMNSFVMRHVENVKKLYNESLLRQKFEAARPYYTKSSKYTEKKG